MARDLDDQLTKYLTDAHAMEVQALAQMRSAPDMAGDERLAAAFREHETETERHERLIRERLDARDASPSKLEDLLGKLSGKGFVLFAKSQPDTPGKLAAHAFSYEHLELATYDLLERVASRAGDEETARVAREIRDDEDAMASRIAGLWDAAVAASGSGPDDVDAYLADAHALENQAIELLQRSEPPLDELFAEHLEESREHRRLIESLGGEPTRLKDAAMKLGGLNWAGFFKAQPDTPAKLAAFAYAFEHLEIGGYEQLRRLGDARAAAIADRILPDERRAAEKLYAMFTPALDASLDAVVSG
jgi:ferritin-like metal-binding protein YciE